MPPKTCTRSRGKKRKRARTNEEEVNTGHVEGQVEVPAEQGVGPDDRAHAVQSKDNAGSQDLDGGVEETESEVSQPRAEEKKTRKERVSSNLTREDEEMIVDWLREHPEMYDKRMSQYKNTQKKESLWQEKADEMDTDVTVLKVWYKSLRTRLGKLMKTKSGQAADQEMTDRDRWILTNMEFLRLHIERVRRRPLLGHCTADQTTASSTTGQASDEFDNNMPGAPDDPDTPEAGGPMPMGSRTKASRGQPSCRSRRGDEADGQLLASLKDQGTNLMAMQQQLLELLKPQGDQERLGFLEFVRSTLHSLNHDCWRRCQKDLLQLLMRYIDVNEGERRSQQTKSANYAPLIPPTSVPADSCFPGPSSAAYGYAASQHTWQPPPNQWPTHVQNNTSVWGSMEPRWLQQQFPQPNTSCSSESRPLRAPPVTLSSTAGSDQRLGGFSRLLMEAVDHSDSAITSEGGESQSDH